MDNLDEFKIEIYVISFKIFELMIGLIWK